jgi:threonine aldolase
MGQVYSPDEVAALSKVAKSRNLPIHMDGARFANAVAALGVPPADVTWRAGVDVLSFGGTKNGCVAAEAVVFFDKEIEAVVFFDKEMTRDVPFARQRAGWGLSKVSFIAAQFDAYLAGGHWLDLARHANDAAAQLSSALRASPNARLAVEPGANEIFAVLSKSLDEKLKAAGAVYYPWDDGAFAPSARPKVGEVLVRLVTSWQTTAEEVAAFSRLVAE